MSRRWLFAIAATGVALVALWLALVLSWEWAFLPPGLFCLLLFVTAEDASSDSPSRS